MIEPSSLQKYSLFGGLLEEEISKLLPYMETEEFDPGGTIIQEGSPNDKIRFIIEGRVAVVKNGIILSEFSEGDEFGEMEVLDVMPSAATVTALATTRVISISNRCLREIHRDAPSSFSLMIMNLARDLSRRLRKMDEKLAVESPHMEWN
ncbi:MAG: cyclic nucleotide-binding domain-containing protein [Treponema sp.]|jgi:CRP-like cAMP-binding protein|nr:cyclic nucleotide-binding domain-containing protein [Treponema sp.]